MAGFKYRLERILQIREEELDEAKNNLQKAISYLRQMENKLQQNLQEQIINKQALVNNLSRESPQIYFNRLKNLTRQQEKLEQNLQIAQWQEQTMRQALLVAQQKAEVLRKHKEKNVKTFLENERKKEENTFNEMGLMIKIRRDREDKEEEREEEEEKEKEREEL